MTQPETRRSDEPFAAKKFLDIGGHKMAYIDEGEGPAIVFQHGNPTSSYLWRNVMPHLKGHGRLIAADFIGMGDSDKLDPALGPSRYSFTEQKKYLFALWDALDLGNDVILVLHDTGSMFGFDWANQHRDRVQGIAYMESIVAPLIVSDFLTMCRNSSLISRRKSWKPACKAWIFWRVFCSRPESFPMPRGPIIAHRS